MAFDTTVIDDDVAIDTQDEQTPEPEQPEHDDGEQPEPEQAESEQNEAESDDEQQDEPESKPKKGAAARIQQLVAEKKAAEAELERLRQESQQPKQQPNPDGEPIAPDVNEFDLDTDEGLEQYFKAQSEYDKKRSDWEFEQKLQQYEQSKQQKQREEEITNQFKQRFEKNPEFKKNFEQLTTLMQDKPINADPSQLYQGDELMDLLEHVAGDPDLYYEIASLPEQAQYAKFGEIQASIKARKSNPVTNRQTKAPPPPNHTKSNAPIARSEYDKSDDDFLAARGLY